MWRGKTLTRTIPNGITLHPRRYAAHNIAFQPRTWQCFSGPDSADVPSCRNSGLSDVARMQQPAAFLHKVNEVDASYDGRSKYWKEQVKFIPQKEKEKKKRRSCWKSREVERERQAASCKWGMVLTRTHGYVAEFGLDLRPPAGQDPAPVHTAPAPRPGAPPTGHGAQTPWRPLLPQPMHCKHPRTHAQTQHLDEEWGTYRRSGASQCRQEASENERIVRSMSLSTFLKKKHSGSWWFYGIYKSHSPNEKSTENETVLTCYCMEENGGYRNGQSGIWTHANMQFE